MTPTTMSTAEHESGPAAPPSPPLKSRLNVISVTFILFVLATVWAGVGIEGSGREIDYLASFTRFAKRFFPPDLSPPVLRDTLLALAQTVQIALLATAAAVVLALGLGFAAAQNVSPGWLVGLTRQLLNAIRTIPSLVWALLAVAVVGPNPLAGVIALTCYSLGYLGKFFSEAFESMDMEVARGLRAIGADVIQSFQYGLWPHAKPLVWSYSLWMLEYNIRSAAIIGYVGAGGVGLQLHTYQEYGQWDRFCTVLLFILVVVTALDFVGEAVRRRITRRPNQRLAES